MLYSGADLIRMSGQQQQRAAQLEIQAPNEVKATAQAPQSSLDEETKGALLRFARFVNGNKKEGRRPHSKMGKSSLASNQHPYAQAQRPMDQWYEVGQNLDIYT